MLDSPPVLAVTDPCLLARAASGVLFVVACGQTSRDEASAAVERLEAVGANFVGAVLNRVVLGRRGQSYLSYYHDYPAYYPQQGSGVSVPQLAEAPSSPEFATIGRNSVAPQEPLAAAQESGVERPPSRTRTLLRVEAARRRAGASPVTEPPVSNPWEV